MTLIKDLLDYLRYKSDINHNYWFAIKEGFCQDEDYNWRQRLDYWRKCEAYDYEKD